MNWKLFDDEIFLPEGRRDCGGMGREKGEWGWGPRSPL